MRLHIDTDKEWIKEKIKEWIFGILVGLGFFGLYDMDFHRQHERSYTLDPLDSHCMVLQKHYGRKVNDED